MKPTNKVEKRTAEENNMENDRENEGNEKDEEFIFVAGQQPPWQESTHIIATRGFIKTV